jgi:hypothetical protein
MSVKLLLNNSDKELDLISAYGETRYNDDGSTSPLLRFLFNPNEFSMSELYTLFSNKESLESFDIIDINIKRDVDSEGNEKLTEERTPYRYTNYSELVSVSFNSHITAKATDTTPQIEEKSIEIVLAQLSYIDVLLKEREELIDAQAEAMAEILCGE